MTVYDAKYFAHELAKRCAPDSVGKLDTWAEDQRRSLEADLV